MIAPSAASLLAAGTPDRAKGGKVVLGFARVPGPAEGADDSGGRVAARDAGPERGRVPGALRDRGGVPRGALRHALARGPDLPGLRVLSAFAPKCPGSTRCRGFAR